MSNVTVFVPVVKKRRKGAHQPRWWKAEIPKGETFTIEDFTPLAVRETNGYYGTAKTFYFYVETLDVEKRVVVAKPYEVADSRSWPLERTLHGCGWEQCDPPSLNA